MAASILSTTLAADGYYVVLQNADGSAGPQFQFAASPPDGRGSTQWQTDCQNAALAIANSPAPGNGGPDASGSIDTLTATQ